MAEPRVLVQPDKPRAGPALEPNAAAAWRMVELAALGFLVVGGTDALLTWVPLRFGTPEWEFGTVTASLNGLPLPMLSLALIMASGLVLGRRWQVRAAAVLFAVIGALVLLAGLFYALTVPIALRAMTEGVAREGLYKSVFRTLMQLVVYPTTFFILAVWAWRRTRVVRQGEA